MIRLISIMFLFLFLSTSSVFADWEIGTKMKCGTPTIGEIGGLNQGIASDVTLCACSGNNCKWIRIDTDEVFKLVEYLKDNKQDNNKIVNKKVSDISNQIEDTLSK